MRRSASRRWIVMMGAVACATASCSLLVDTSDLSGGSPSDGGREAATDSQPAVRFDAAIEAAVHDATTIPPDAGVDADASADTDADAAPFDAGPRKNSCGALLFGTPIPVFNGDFELGCANGFTTYATTPKEDTVAPSSGAIACKLCYVTGGGPDGYFITAGFTRNVVPGERYEAVACVRSIVGADAGSAVHIELSADTEGSASTSIATTETYQSIRMGFSPTSSHSSIGFNVRGISQDGDCFLVDDLSFALIEDAGPH